jgi:hypothetical protein
MLLIRTLSCLGAALVIAMTFCIDPFELFGLRGCR